MSRDEPFAGALHDAALDDRGHHGWRLSAARAAHLHPMGNRPSDLGRSPVGAPALIVDPEQQPDLDADLVAKALGLTRAQDRRGVAAGRSVQEVATATACRENSVRYLLKQAYRKLGVARQVDLVRLVLPLSGFTGSGH